MSLGRSGDIDRIRTLGLFSSMDDRAFSALTSGAFLQRFPAGTTLLFEGDRVDFLYILLDGAVELQGTWSDKETTMAILRPVSSFILAAVVLDSDALMSAKTLERSEILMLSATAIRRQMQEDPAFASRVAEELSGCYRGLVRTIKNQKLRGGSERLANYILAQDARFGNAGTFTLQHEKRVLASLLGMTPENLSRAFATLTDYGVSVNGPEVRITRPEVLRRLAKPTPLIDTHLATGDAPISQADFERQIITDPT